MNKLPVPSSLRALAETNQNGPMLVEIVNPHFDPNNFAEPERIIVKRATRDDPLGSMRAHGTIDELQFLAGREWQMLYERASISSVRAMDPSKDIVDGGAPPSFGSDGQRIAMNRIVKTSAALGTFGTQLVILVLADGLRIDQAAAVLSTTRGQNERAIGVMFRMALDALVIEFGYSTAAPMKRAA